MPANKNPPQGDLLGAPTRTPCLPAGREPGTVCLKVLAGWWMADLPTEL